MFWQECTEVFVPTVPHVDKPCWYTLDPASHLVTSHYHEGMPEFPPEMLNHEYYGDDVNQISDVVCSRAGISTLHEATGGDPSSSPSWQMNMALGGDQEMIAALRTLSGEVWGAVGLYREPGQGMFDADDKAFLKAIAPDLAAGARAGLLVGEARDPQWPDSPGARRTLRGRGGRVHHARGGALALRPAGRRPRCGQVADRRPRGGRPRAADGGWLRQAGRRGARPCALALGDLGRPSRRLARRLRFAACSGDRRSGASGANHAASDVGLWPNRARAGGHTAGPSS